MLGGVPITRIAQAEETGCVVFQAGTKLGDDGRLLTHGGRVLAVSAVGASLADAVEAACRLASTMSTSTRPIFARILGENER